MLRHKIAIKTVLACFFICLHIFLRVPLSPAADSPHNSVNAVDCVSCHNDAQAAQYPEWWTRQDLYVCGTCHNSATEFYAVTHEKNGVIIAQCTGCHDPHRQQQSRQWKTASYLYSSTSDLAGGITGTALKKTGAGWAVNQWKDMLLLPNVLTPLYIYRIVSNTSDTLFIDTRGEAPDNQINTSSVKSGNTFGIVRGNYVKPVINGKYVRFFRETGTNSFADDTPTIDGVCQVCHTTSSFSKTGMLEGPGHPVKQAGKKCITCHNHKSNFKASCKDCHGTPPTQTTAGGPDGLPDDDGGTGSTTTGAHAKHAVTIGYSCDTCHAGGMPESAIYDKKLQIGFNIADGAYQTGAYDGRDTLDSGYTYSAGNATTVTQGGPTPMQCSNIYCHGSTIVSGGTNKTPDWDTPASGACGTCHGISGATNYPTRASHTRHTGPKDSNIGFEIGCQICHKTTTDGTAITDQSRHVNNAADWGFDTTDSRVSSAKYRSASSGAASNPPSSTYGTCSTAYCHGGTLQSGGTNTTPTWGNAATAACGSCHGISDATNYPTRGSHTRHTGPLAGNIGLQMNCKTCHNSTTTTGNSITDTSKHVNNAADWGFDASDSKVSSGQYRSASSGSVPNPPSGSYGACSTVYCHSIVQTATGGPLTGAPGEYKTPTWGGAVGCGSCHKGDGGHTPDKMDSGSHAKHLTYSFTMSGDTMKCVVCHKWNTVNTIAQMETDCSLCHSYAYPLHADNQVYVFIPARFGGSYNGTPAPGDSYSNCSNTYCHSNGTSVATEIITANTSSNWGSSSLSCNSCHGTTTGNGMPDYANGAPKANSHSAHYNSYNSFLNYTCDTCHAATTTNGTTIANTINHVNTQYDLQAGGTVTFDYKYYPGGGTCSSISCHSNTGTTWGAAACVDCHTISINGRAAITPQFSATSHHIQGATVNSRHCYQCHWEANEDGSINPAYHAGSAVSGSAVDLVIYGAGTRPSTYSAATAIQYTPDGSRLQIGRITTHCLGCHSEQNNDIFPFEDDKKPKQYAWNGASIDMRYSQMETTIWGKYNTAVYPNVTPKYDRLKAYSPHGNASANQRGWDRELWSTMTSAPGTIYSGGALAYDGNDYIYATRGVSTADFYRYSISANSWISLASLPAAVSYGSDLVYDGNNYIYATRGSNTATLYRYSISGNSWTTLASAPETIFYGGDLAYSGGDYIYATRGNWAATFYRYSISANSWTALAPLPASLYLGGSLVHGGDYIYATRGYNSDSFYRYSISGNSWTTLTSAPGTIYYGAELAYSGGDYIYATRGNGTATFYRYSISGNSWIGLASLPNAVHYGSGIVFDGNGYIYITRGGNTSEFYRYRFDTSGTVNVACFDCHNSHGSNAGSDTDDRTTSYTSAAGGVKGGILKDTILSPSGYSVLYRPAFGGSDANNNLYKAGAGLCFDCHMNSIGGESMPWGYNSTFGAAKAIMSYWDTPYFGAGTFESQQKYAYKAGLGHVGGHLGNSVGTMNTNPIGAINGLCTSCHDPHGVDQASANPQYKVPLLKGTYLTSPYKEDVAPAVNGTRTINNVNAGDVYHIDQNTFGSDIRTAAGTGIAQEVTEFAGLCLQCHPQTAIDPDTSTAWRSMDRLHDTVKGWGSTKHRYTCSKCHAPHNSRLPRLMITNCLDTKHKARVQNNLSSVLSGFAPLSCGSKSGSGGPGCGGGEGWFPGTHDGGGNYNPATANPSYVVTCHENDSADQNWNERTRWP